MSSIFSYDELKTEYVAIWERSGSKFKTRIVARKDVDLFPFQYVRTVGWLYDQYVMPKDHSDLHEYLLSASKKAA